MTTLDGRGNSYRCAGLDKEFANWGTVVHGVERSHLVDSHRGHLEEAGDLVHDANAGEAMLTLSEVKKGHDGSLLVLRGVPFEDLRHEGLILRVELEGEIGVVVGGVSVLRVDRVCQSTKSPPCHVCVCVRRPPLPFTSLISILKMVDRWNRDRQRGDTGRLAGCAGWLGVEE